MKKLLLAMLGLIVSLLSDAFPRHIDMTGDYEGSIMYGDYEISSGDILVGEPEEDDPDFGEGAPKRRKRPGLAGRARAHRDKTAAVTSGSIAVANKSTSSVDAAAAKEVAKIAAAERMSSPGVAMDAAGFKPYLIENATVDAEPATKLLPGASLKVILMNWFVECYWPSKNYTTTASSGVTSVTIGGANDAASNPWNEVLVTGEVGDEVYTLREIRIPWLFITLTSGALVSQSGAQISLSVTAYNQYGFPLEASSLIIKRKDVRKQVEAVYFPYIRVRDAIYPQNMVVRWGKADESFTALDKIVVSADGLSEGEQLQVHLPGLDSSKAKGYLNAWGFKF